MVKSPPISIHNRKKGNVTGTMNIFSFVNIICNNFKSLFKVKNRNTDFFFLIYTTQCNFTNQKHQY